jgi:hypothetical protein
MTGLEQSAKATPFACNDLNEPYVIVAVMTARHLPNT